MLIGNSSQKPSLQVIRRIKLTLRKALDLPDNNMVTVTQLSCLEEDCAPLETVIGVLRPELAQLQYKVHKATDAIDVDDLMQVCEAWGYTIQKTVLDSLFKEN